VEDEKYDTVFSSHCIEHMRNPLEALLNWYRVLKPGGYLIVLAPEEDLYEQHNWPSLFNDDHKWGMTLHKDATWCPSSCNLLDLTRHLYRHKLISLTLQDSNYEYGIPVKDQTQGENVEAAVELVVRKQVFEDGVRTSFLKVPIYCPACGGHMILLGVREDGHFSLNCSKCGAFGGIDPAAINPRVDRPSDS
jgi:SAM-dependent methyltransferase